MRRPPNIFISPHRDDACFSLSATISLLGGGHLVNIFTQSEYVADPSLALQSPALSASTITAIRSREDQEFCEALNLERHELELPEATLRGRSWNLEQNQEPGEEELQQANLIHEQIAPLLQNIIAATSFNKSSVYLPMAIGSHRDHIATMIAGKMLQENPWAQAHNWFFYEDLPYASWPGERALGIPRFHQSMCNPNLRKHYLPLSPEQITHKMKLVNIYSSQHYSEPNDKDFFCSDSWLLGPHEAIWK